jgi:dimethylhistidine N-methyltransferase
MDISRDHLLDSVARLSDDYPWLAIQAACVDYSENCELPDLGEGRRNAFFPGSSIGNFEQEAALGLLHDVRALVGRGGGLLIGVDLKKRADILEGAYNDAEGVTARFNLNILEHINRRLGADFAPENFSHEARYNTALGRIEMHLKCLTDHAVSIGRDRYEFEAGETIHTENSYKYTVAEFQRLAGRAGWSPVETWTDEEGLFSLQFLRAT